MGGLFDVLALVYFFGSFDLWLEDLHEFFDAVLLCAQLFERPRDLSLSSAEALS